MKPVKKIAGIVPDLLAGMAKQRRRHNRALVRKLKTGKRISYQALDTIIHEEHAQHFSKIDCLDCANCCKTTPALIIQEDMDRIAAHLNISVAEFLGAYIEMDEDGDFVTNSTPCSFLNDENKCRIYDVRPASCREYPMTLRKRQVKILDVAVANTEVCPAVFRIFERLDDLLNTGHR